MEPTESPGRKHSFFAIWRWSWKSLISTALVLYILSPVQVDYALRSTGLFKRYPAAHEAMEIFYLPLAFCAMQFGPLLEFYNWQSSWYRPKEPVPVSVPAVSVPKTSPDEISE